MAVIYLTGFMGSGKTTIGEQLAQQMNYEVIDTDQFIENREQKAIASIFAEAGEEYFRKCETEALTKIEGGQLIVTTGGGIIAKQENREMMKAKGTVIYLHCEIDEILRRTEEDSSRPLLKGKNKDQVLALFKQRLPLYQEATYSIDTTKKTVNEVVEQIRAFID